MRIITDPPREPSKPIVAQVSYSDTSGFGAVGASEVKNAPIFAPRGITYKPCVGDRILLQTVDGANTCAGALTSTEGLRPGEIKLFSAGGAQILLDADGNINLNGVIITRNGIIQTH